MNRANIIIGVVAALVLAGGGFAAGMTYDRSQTPATAATNSATTTGARGASGGRGGFGGAGAAAANGQQAVMGRVIAVNDGSITVAAIDRGQGGANGQAAASPTTTSEIVLVGASTRIVKSTETDVKLSDIKVNDQVTLVGPADTTGMVSATTIVIGSTNPLGQLFGSQTGGQGLGGGGRPGASPTARP
jgi:uncharacterized membrane protein